MTLKWRNLLQPLVRGLDRSAAAGRERPAPEEETTRFPELPWDLRTIIIVFGPDKPFRFLNLNLLLGLTGVSFDRPSRLGGLPPHNAFDLQFCLEGRDAALTYKKYHPIREELEYEPGKVRFALGKRMEMDGAWPHYRLRYAQPEEEFELWLDFHSRPGFHWWFYARGVYCHYTSFGRCELRWRRGREEGSLTAEGLHDHGFGRNLLPLRAPLSLFRYEVLKLPEEGHAISLWTEGPFRVRLKNQSLLRRAPEEFPIVGDYECDVLAWDVFENYEGKPCRVPRRWLGRQLLTNRGGQPFTFEYEAARSSQPRPVLGNGFLYGFDYEGRLKGEKPERVMGEGYAEHMGMVMK